MLEFSIVKAAIIFAVTCGATFIGASTGGSGMLTIPLCILLGFPVNAAVGTTRFSAFFSMIGAFCGFSKYKQIDYKLGLIGSFIACIGAYFGSHILLLISDELAKKVIGIAMLALLLVSFFKKHIRKNKVSQSPLKKRVGYLIFFIIGSIGGAFGGQGILLVYTLQLFFGMNITMAAGTRAVISLFITVVSMTVYFKAGVIYWSYGIVLAVASLLGTYFGVIYSVKKGEGFAERIIEILVVMVSFKLLWA